MNIRDYMSARAADAFRDDMVAEMQEAFPSGSDPEHKAEALLAYVSSQIVRHEQVVWEIERKLRKMTEAMNSMYKFTNSVEETGRKNLITVAKTVESYFEFNKTQMIAMQGEINALKLALSVTADKKL